MGSARTAVLGGSFNPVHLGHLLLADDVQEILGLDRVLFVPAGTPPHKPPEALAPAADRYAMVELAIAGHPGFAVSDIEIRRDGPSYTVDTLAALSASGDRVFLVIGSESFLDLLSWREPRRIPTLARLVVVPRTGSAFDPESAAAQKVLREIGVPRFAWADARTESTGGLDGPPDPPERSPAPRGTRGAARPGDSFTGSEPDDAVLLVGATSLPLSASELRARVRAGRSLAYRVPDAVAAYIRARGLYRDALPHAS